MNKKILMLTFFLILVANTQLLIAYSEPSQKDLANSKQLLTDNLQDKYIIIDKTGKQLTKEKYDSVNIITGNCIAVYINKKWGFLDSNGKFIIKPEFTDIRNFSGKIIGVLINNKWGMIDTNGKYIVQPKFDEIMPPSPMELITIKINNKWGMIDFTGKYIIKPDFEYVFNYNGQLTIVEQNGKYGILNIVNNSYIIQPQYDLLIPAFVSRGCILAKKHEKWGIIDTNGKMVLEPQFDEIMFPFSTDLISVKVNNKWGSIDKSGKYIIKPISDAPIKHERGFAIIKNKVPVEVPPDISPESPKVEDKCK